MECHWMAGMEYIDVDDIDVDVDVVVDHFRME